MRVSSTQSAGSTERSLPSQLGHQWALSLLTTHCKQRPTSNSSRSRQSEQGLTLIECLVAIVIISLTVVAITPPIMIAAASRIQSRKVEKANQVAQGEIDRIRLLVERGSYTINDLPQAGDSGSNTLGPTSPSAGSNPTGGLMSSTAYCNTYPGTTALSATALVQVDVDGDCKADYVMQVFRTTGTPLSASVTAPYSFIVGVRVYAYYPSATFLPLDTTRASIRMGTGPLDIVGGKRRPMAVLYSPMARNDSSRSLGQLCIQTGGNCTY